MRVTIAGRDFYRWSSYDIATDIFSPPARFAFEIGKVDPSTLAVLTDGAPLEVFIDVGGEDQMLMTGHINARTHSYAKGQHAVSISGADLAAELQVSTAPLDTNVKDVAFVDVVVDLLDPWGITVIYTNEASRYMTASKPKWKKSLNGMSKEDYHDKVKQLQRDNPTKSGFKQACKDAGLLEWVIPPHVHDGIMNKKDDDPIKRDYSCFR